MAKKMICIYRTGSLVPEGAEYLTSLLVEEGTNYPSVCHYFLVELDPFGSNGTSGRIKNN